MFKQFEKLKKSDFIFYLISVPVLAFLAVPILNLLSPDFNSNEGKNIIILIVFSFIASFLGKKQFKKKKN